MSVADTDDGVTVDIDAPSAHPLLLEYGSIITATITNVTEIQSHVIITYQVAPIVAERRFAVRLHGLAYRDLSNTIGGDHESWCGEALPVMYVNDKRGDFWTPLLTFIENPQWLTLPQYHYFLDEARQNTAKRVGVVGTMASLLFGVVAGTALSSVGAATAMLTGLGITLGLMGVVVSRSATRVENIRTEDARLMECDDDWIVSNTGINKGRENISTPLAIFDTFLETVMMSLFTSTTRRGSHPQGANRR